MGWESEGVGYLGICSTTVGLCCSHVFVVQSTDTLCGACCCVSQPAGLATCWQDWHHGVLWGRSIQVIHICNLQQGQHTYNRNSNTNSNPCCNELDVKSLADIIIMKFIFGSSMYVRMYVCTVPTYVCPPVDVGAVCMPFPCVFRGFSYTPALNCFVDHC